MFEVWKITQGTMRLIESRRDAHEAREVAIEQSNLDSAAYVVIRQGFGAALYAVWRGVVSDPVDVMRRMSAVSIEELSTPMSNPDGPTYSTSPLNTPGPEPDVEVPKVEIKTEMETPPDPKWVALAACSVVELRNMAAQLNIPYRSNMNKDQLIAAIRAARSEPGPSETKALGDTSKREYKQTSAFVISTKVSDDGKLGIVESIVNTYGIIDDGHDISHPGWLARTIVENKKRIRVLNSHNTRDVNAMVGKPLAMREVGREELPADILERFPEATGGLWTQSQFMLSDPSSKAVFDRIEAGWIDEWSIGFDDLQSDMSRVKRVFNGTHHEFQVWQAGDEKNGFDMVRDDRGQPIVVRHLRQGRLWEYSPVLWGLNPGTGVVSVKESDSAPQEETDPDARKEMTPQGPVMRLGDTIVGRVFDVFDFTINMFLMDGRISIEEHAAIKAAGSRHIAMIPGDLPDDLSLRDMSPFMMWGKDGSDETKIGRVLSERNYNAIKQAHELLTTVMDSAGLSDGDGASEGIDDAKSRHDSNDDATDGPPASTDAPTPIPGAGPQDDETPATKHIVEQLQQRLANLEAT